MSCASFSASSDGCGAESAPASKPAQVSAFSRTRQASYGHAGCRVYAVVRSDSHARCSHWAVCATARRNGRRIVGRSSRLLRQACRAAPGAGVCRCQVVAAMRQRGLGCRIHLVTRDGRHRRGLPDVTARKRCASIVGGLGQSAREIGSGVPRNIGDRSTKPPGTIFAKNLHLPAWQSAQEVV